MYPFLAMTLFYITYWGGSLRSPAGTTTPFRPVHLSLCLHFFGVKLSKLQYVRCNLDGRVVLGLRMDSAAVSGLTRLSCNFLWPTPCDTEGTYQHAHSLYWRSLLQCRLTTPSKPQRVERHGCTGRLYFVVPSLAAPPPPPCGNSGHAYTFFPRRLYQNGFELGPTSNISLRSAGPTLET